MRASREKAASRETPEEKRVRLDALSQDRAEKRKARTPEQIEKEREYFRLKAAERRLKKRDEVLAYRREWHAKNKDKINSKKANLRDRWGEPARWRALDDPLAHWCLTEAIAEGGPPIQIKPKD